MGINIYVATSMYMEDRDGVIYPMAPHRQGLLQEVEGLGAETSLPVFLPDDPDILHAGWLFICSLMCFTLSLYIYASLMSFVHGL